MQCHNVVKVNMQMKRKKTSKNQNVDTQTNDRHILSYKWKLINNQIKSKKKQAARVWNPKEFRKDICLHNEAVKQEI